MLARFLGENAVNSRAGSPITGGHLVTCLARSFDILSSRLVCLLTRIPSNVPIAHSLETMHVVEIVRGVDVIMGDDSVLPIKQVEKTRPKGRQNVQRQEEQTQ